jgi:putative transposase
LLKWSPCEITRVVSTLPTIAVTAHSLTICTYNRMRPFADSAIVCLVLLPFLRAAEDERCEVLAYCFMPDHVHAVIIAHDETADLPRFVRLAKQRSGFIFTRATGRRLWQESYFDRTVRKADELPGLVEYMIRNPLRAGLVGDPVDYPHWGSPRYSREELLEFVASARRNR